jgi:hypothetical protein
VPAPVQKLLTDDAGFDGWVRVDGSSWRVVHSAPTAAEVWDMILPLRLGQHCEKAVLAAGDRPDAKRRK